MARTMLRAAVLVLALMALCGQMASALTLMSPTDGQTVKENIKFVFPSAALPKDGYVSLDLVMGDDLQLITATDQASDTITTSGDQTTFIWNTKAPFFTSSDDRTGRLIGDGQHVLSLHIHDASGNTVDKTRVTVNVKNTIDRSSSEPGILLFYKLPYGQQNLYIVQSKVALLDSSDNPTMDTLRMSGEFRLSQSVEDVQPDGLRLMRYKVGNSAYISYYGGRQPLYTAFNKAPQVYRLLNKFGSVTDPDVVGGKNKNVNVMDILQVLPTTPVKTGDTWPDKMNLKLEGLTDLVALDGTATLTGFEWQDGRECAKIESELKGNGLIRFTGVQSAPGAQIVVKSVTYFAYNENRAIRRELNIEFPAIMVQGANVLGPTGAGAGMMPGMGPGASMPGGMPGAMMPGMGGMPGAMMPGMGPGASMPGGMDGPPMPGANMPGMGPGGMMPGMGPGATMPGAMVPGPAGNVPMPARPGMPGMPDMGGGFSDMNPTGGMMPPTGPMSGAAGAMGMGGSGQQKGKAQINVIIVQEK